jgi:hypothetical protein
VAPGGSGAWQTKFETISQLIPESPIELNPMQSPSFAESFCGISAEAKSPNQFDPVPSTFFTDTCSCVVEKPAMNYDSHSMPNNIS